jgi:general secretion pathway protein D
MKKNTMNFVPYAVYFLIGTALVGCTSPSRQSADKEFKKTNFEAAMSELQKAKVVNPESNAVKAGLIQLKSDAVAALTQQFMALRTAEQWDAAQQVLKRARDLEPSNSRLLALNNELELDRFALQAYNDAVKLKQDNNLSGALIVLEQALKLYPTHIKLGELRKQVEAQINASATDDSKSRSQISLATSIAPITLDFKNAPLVNILEAVSKHVGINFVFDRDLKQDTPVTLYLKQVQAADAIDMILGSQGLTRKIIDPNTVFIYSNTPDKLREHQEQIVRVFHLSNAEAKTTATLLRTMLKIKDPFVDERANLLAIRESPELVSMAEKLVTLHDIRDAEVMLDVEVLEVNSNRLLDLGVNLPNTFSLTPLVLAASSAASSATGLTAQSITQLNRKTVGVSVSPLSFNFRRDIGDTNVLANPRIRAKNREKARIVIGDKVPVVTTSSSSNGIVGQTVNYLEVGLKLDVEPQVSPDDEINLKLDLEVSSITQQISTGNGGTAYQIGTRNASTTLRLRDGETQFLGGLISNSDKSNSSRIPGLGDLPIFGRLFGLQQDSKTKNELVMAITPRILRSAPHPTLMQAQFSVGTEQTPQLKVFKDYLNTAIKSNVQAVSNSAASPISQSKELISMPINSVVNNPINTSINTLPNKIHNADIPVLDTATAQPFIHWHAAKDNYVVGDVFEVTLVLDSAKQVRSLPIELDYSAEALEVIEVQEKNLLRTQQTPTSFVYTVNPQTGKISISQSRGDGSGIDSSPQEISDTGKINNAVITVRLKAKQVGNASLTVSNMTIITTNNSFPVNQKPSFKITIQ